jgi:mRNA-degrading endonuclease RelE of RelBE toxin-antitoxin system
MKVTVRITKNFKSEVKPLMRKYPSLSADLAGLEEQLLLNPKAGIEIGKNVYKVRLRIKSKGRGKSGGARVITLLENYIIAALDHSADEITVNLISIYDKGDVDTISDKEIKRLVDIFHSS